MSKYDFILYARDYQDFIVKVRDLGLVDITTANWESSEKEHEIMLNIEAHTKSEKFLAEFAQSEEYVDSAVETPSEKIYSLYTQTQAQRAELQSEITSLKKSAEENVAWGEFSTEALAKLAEQGLHIHFFVCNSSTYENNEEQWRTEYAVELINEVEGNSYFVVITPAAEDVMIDAQEIKQPTTTAATALKRASELQKSLDEFNITLSSCAKGVSAIAKEREDLIAELQFSKIRTTADQAADGSLLVINGWAEESTSVNVDALLEDYPSVVFIKSKPTPEDNTPVKLTNKFFAHVFELIGNMYALPKYGTMDLTPLFAPFYMLFFAICLCDAGYGAVILAAGIGLYFKGGESMRQASWLSIICGVASVAFGLFANSLFGVAIFGELSWAQKVVVENGVEVVRPLFNFQQDFFSIAMIIGIIQILLGMAVNIVVSSRTFGFKYALGNLGWFLLILSGSLSAALNAMGVTFFGFTSIPFLVTVAIAAILMLFFNSPGQNIFANFGAGLWNTYNNITGILSDVLSYIRLFAIGLSGGVLALVFNSLATGMTGIDAGIDWQNPGGAIAQILGASAILLIGHGINLFMSAISSFVHPMRLTFVEFFKNAGFEMATRKFDPLK